MCNTRKKMFDNFRTFAKSNFWRFAKAATALTNFSKDETSPKV